MMKKIKFEEVATHRLDGSYAYFSVDILNNDLFILKIMLRLMIGVVQCGMD